MGDGLEELRRLYLEEARGTLTQFERLLEALEADPRRAGGPLAELRARAHRLKGSGGSYGYPRLSALAGEMEEALQGDGPAASPEMRRLRVLLQEMRAELRRAATELEPQPGREALLEQGEETAARSKVAIVDDDPYLLEFIGEHLRQAGFVIRALKDPTGALAALREFKPDLLLLDIEMPALTGLELCAALRREAEFQKLPIFFLTGRSDLQTKVQGLEAGADDYITKPFHPEELIARIAARLARNRVLTELADRDGLTGLYNHRAFQEKLRCTLERSRRYGRAFALALLDLDRFKAVNDRYGHRMGDVVLKALAELLRSRCRKSDLPARYGGDEFALILPESAKPQAVAALTRLQTEFNARCFSVGEQAEPFKASFSAGVAGFPEDGASPDELLEQADRALYRAKGLGGARVLPAEKA